MSKRFANSTRRSWSSAVRISRAGVSAATIRTVALAFGIPLALAKCAGHVEPAPDENALATLERARLIAEGAGADERFAVAQIDDVALVADDFGEGWATAIYRRSAGRWQFVVAKGNAPGPCLFVAAKVPAADAEELTRRLLSRANELKPMTLDVVYDGCVKPTPIPT